MSIIICNIIIALVGIGITPYMANLIDAFSTEEDIKLKDIVKKRKIDVKLALITPLVLIALFFKFGISVQFLVYAFLGIILIMDSFIDMRAQIIPNALNFTGFIVGMVLVYITITMDVLKGIDMILGMFVGGGIFLLIALFAYVAYKKEGMGLGDVKLMGMLGIFFGVFNTIQIFIISFAIGAVISIFLLVTKIKKGSDYIAFGPFIVMATVITIFIPYREMLPVYINLINSISTSLINLIAG